MHDENLKGNNTISLSEMKEMGYTIIHKLAMDNEYDKLAIALEKGVDPDIKGMLNNTPLHLAVLHRNREVFDLLLAYGANPNTSNAKGITPFHYAIMSDNEEIINKLLVKGADVITPLRNKMLPHEAAISISGNNDMSQQIEAIYNMQTLRERMQKQFSEENKQDTNKIISLSMRR